MSTMSLTHALSAQQAVQCYRDHASGANTVAYCAGGTTLVDLMKLGVIKPAMIVDLLPLTEHLQTVALGEKDITIGALATMSRVADHPGLQKEAPMVIEALRQAASPQIRNVATIGGNLLQRTRCSYFRDRHSPCNKRLPGSGCGAITGERRSLAIVGTSDHCIANYPGDLAVALVALDAEVRLLSPDGTERSMLLETLHRLPGDTPHIETSLAPGELITSVRIPRGIGVHSRYVKLRDRASYAFALASAAVALALEADGRTIRDARIALGGLAAKPWRCRNAERSLYGHQLDLSRIRAAAGLTLTDARLDPAQDFKVELGRRTVMRGLVDLAGQLGVPL